MLPCAYICCLPLLLLLHLTQAHSPDDNSTLTYQFTKPQYHVYIQENSSPRTYATQKPGSGFMGIQIPTNSSIDIRYRIMDGDKEHFFKAEARAVGTFCFLFVRLRTGKSDVLNRERKDKYSLSVRAFLDGGRRTSDAQVVVSVTDADDLRPMFFPAAYEAVVAEDAPTHREVARVVAADADLGVNGEVYYSIVGDTDQFEIDPVTGVISLSRPIRYQDGSRHVLTVGARDRGADDKHGRASSKANVTVHVKRANFHAPDIKVERQAQIVENSDADVYAVVTVTDKDAGVHGEIADLEIVAGDPDGHFRVRRTGPAQFNVEVYKLVDREAAPGGYQLQLRATDKGVPPKTGYRSINVSLADFHDDGPVFSKEIYEVRVSETAPANTPLVRLRVSDAVDARVALELVGGNEGGEFRLHPDTGVLYTAVALDAEQRRLYSLTAAAVDLGAAAAGRRQSSAKVKVYVDDANDNDPEFERRDDEGVVWLDENMPAGTSVTTVHAKDKDQGENAYISYLLANLNDVPFEIDHFSGVVHTSRLLDYESMRRTYTLHLRASDWGLPYRRQTEMRLIVRLRDVNDNRPQFEKVDCFGEVSRRSAIGSEVVVLSAIDFDAGSIISYRLEAGNEDGCFGVDATSGAVFVACDLGDVKAAERELNVTATDDTHFADLARVRMRLVDDDQAKTSVGGFECRDTGVARRLTEVLAEAENNNRPEDEDSEFPIMPTRYGQNVHPPEFVDFPVEVRVNESVALGATLVALAARDRDLGYNGRLVFGISGGDARSQFAVDLNSGEFKVIGHLDREKQAEYFLNVTVYDLGRPQKSSSRVLPVTVLDVNDNAPEFEKALASFRVAENAVNGTAVFRAHATDSDGGDVVYSLAADAGGDFCVDGGTGVLAVCGALDRERRGSYELRIRATDGGGKGTDDPPLFSEALVRVTVDDINDNAPKFGLPSYAVNVREDVPVGTVVAVVAALDPDEGAAGQVTYSLANPDDDDMFKVDSSSGTIRTASALDFERRPQHTLAVVARDGGSPALSSEATVAVAVVDVDENRHAPQFADAVYAAAVRENRPVGAFVLRVRATDADLVGDDARVEYSIRAGDGLGAFAVDGDGVVTTLAALDVETKRSYWITVYAQDCGVFPRFSTAEVYVEVLDENDNHPLSEQAVYYPIVAEESPAGVEVLRMRATDRDVGDGTNITYRISAGNPEGFFDIDATSGALTTTSRKLDRETQHEHILEVTICDNGSPPLSSVALVVVAVEDVNDNAPEFEQAVYEVRLPSRPPDPREPLFRVPALDRDAGANAQLKYQFKAGKHRARFSIDAATGAVYAVGQDFAPGQEFELHVRVSDKGEPPKTNTCKVHIVVAPEPSASNSPPSIAPLQPVRLSEGEAAGFLVATVAAVDPDNDTVWFSIVGGDPRGHFHVRRDVGNVVLVGRLDRETQSEYSLNVSVCDGGDAVYATLNVSVANVNDERPAFSRPLYEAELSEAVPIYSEVLRLEASDGDDDDTLLFSFHSAENVVSLRTFILDPETGVITLAASLDRETLDEHVLTVAVKDGGTPARRNLARVRVTVRDHNDHAPQFLDRILEGGAFETAAVGTAVARAVAVDRDGGDNARIAYSIVSGNVGNVFQVDPVLGIISIAKDLQRSPAKEFILYVKASDHGEPPLSAVVPAHIVLTMADDSPPKFAHPEIVAEIYEDLPLFSYVAHLEVKSTSSLRFEIVEGNVDGAFTITPSTGVVTIFKYLDYETVKFYNLSIVATNMASISASCRVVVHVLDRNDNAPQFSRLSYAGFVSESAPPHSLVLVDAGVPLVVEATDADSGPNALLRFDIVENLPRKYFDIDPSTGAVRTVATLDYERRKSYSFHVRLSDRGVPKLVSDTIAKVEVAVTDANDCPPKFRSPVYNVTILLPTYDNITVVQLNATDPDSAALKYDLLDGADAAAFRVNGSTGLVTLASRALLNASQKLLVRASDGVFSDVAEVYVYADAAARADFRFQKAAYEATVLENSAKATQLCLVHVLGAGVDEHVRYRLLYPDERFFVVETSGAVFKSAGVAFDREVRDEYEVVVEAAAEARRRVAHATVRVVVADANDNCPEFVDAPYYGAVSATREKGGVVTRVRAVDADAAENGEVRYELVKGPGELFKVRRETGQVEVKQKLEGYDDEYELVVAAYDKGMTPCRTETVVYIKVVNDSMPVFERQFYSANVSEDAEVHAPLAVAIRAVSPQAHDVIYTIVGGNEMEKFDMDPRSGTLSVTDDLDYERVAHYRLTVRATDVATGVRADVPVAVAVLDANDCHPEFDAAAYNVSASEATPRDARLLTVRASDADAGRNARVAYSIEGDDVGLFYVDENEGAVFLGGGLDRERQERHHFVVVARDGGTPSLSSKAHVWLEVLDTNDNAPVFEEESSASCRLSVGATRGQFVAAARAVDADAGDVLRYAVVDGDDRQTFAMDADSGVLTLASDADLAARRVFMLNVSASDGVFTTYTGFKVELVPENLHPPRFNEVFKDVQVPENRPSGYPVTAVAASDEDMGEFGNVTYAIPSELMRKVFVIDEYTGKLETRTHLDRETQKLYQILVMATDGGGLADFMTVRVKVTDENDNAPEFLLREYQVGVYANASRDAFATLRAVDADDGANGEVVYSVREPLAAEAFHVDAVTGRLSLRHDARVAVGQVFQFSVRASDKGVPSKHADVPVNVLIMGAADEPPALERNDAKFFLHENSAVGTVITNLRPLSNATVKFEIVSADEDDDGQSQFTVDAQGQVSLARPLDFEHRASHVIGVVALTDSTPPLATLVEIVLQVQDDNDHAPRFESAEYVVGVAENVAKDATVLRVVAHDEDQGTNGEITYNFAADSSAASDTFSIDAHLGWISVIADLDRETQAEYRFHVTASDGGTPRHEARAAVVVRVRDHNDNPTVFVERAYSAEVREDALPGTVLLTLTTGDADAELATPVEFSIVGGDASSRFQIKKRTGEIYVAKPLDRERVDGYTLRVIVSDGRFADAAAVAVAVLDVDDNPPVCARHRYRRALSEDVAPRTRVLSVPVDDADGAEHARCRFVLAGDGADDFRLDKDTGELTTAGPLDREKRSRYSLTAHVHDRERADWQCSSSIELSISDVNDNAPQFASRSSAVAVPEDAGVGALVALMRATDDDAGANRRVRYSFVDAGDDRFAVDAVSGVVSLAKPLDRELKAQYNLTLQATDQGTPRRSTVAYLIVNVQDINDNPPEFLVKHYVAVVPEIDAVGTEVVRVEATSRDVGANAEVNYAIIGGNEHHKFAIDSNTGLITIAESLDFEKGKRYALTIQAVDGGVPPLSSVATVNITVADCNDNAPVFAQSSYDARVREDAKIGEAIIQMVATDLDSGDNGRVSYSIIGGDGAASFAIDAASGHVRVSGALDREATPTYVLEILAKDNGAPALSSQAALHVDLADVNDNPPRFSRPNYTAVVHEDKPIGQAVLQFDVSDADAPPNGRPFTFEFSEGNDANSFRIDQEGRLRTAAKFNRKVRAVHLLRVRVFDNGSPPLYAYASVVVEVAEESRMPPVVTPLDVRVNYYVDDFPGGVIGKVYANDQDRYDVLSYSLSSSEQARGLFRIDGSDGTLEALMRLDAGDYRVNVSVSDGKFSSHATVKVAVDVLSEEAVEKAVAVRFRDVSPDGFVSNHRRRFVRAIRDVMRCRPEDVVIVSLQRAAGVDKARRRSDEDEEEEGGRGQRHLDLLFGVRKPDGDFYAPQIVRKELVDELRQLEETANLVVEQIVPSRCNGIQGQQCQFGICQDHYVLNNEQIDRVFTAFASFVAPRHYQRVECVCKEGYGGDRCDTAINNCAKQPCSNFQICIPDSSEAGYSCQCPEGYSGSTCSESVSDCHESSCYRARNPISFSGKSYSQYKIINVKMVEEQFSLSLRVRTLQLTGNIMYAAGLVDFNILEISNGVVQYRFDLGSGEGVVRVADVFVSDGLWHAVRLERTRNGAKMAVDGAPAAHGSAPGASETLNLHGDELYLGAEVRRRRDAQGFEDVRRGFVGCMDDIRISQVSVPLHESGDASAAVVLKRFANVEFSCEAGGRALAAAGACGSQPCLNGGTCRDAGDAFECACRDRFVGAFCEVDTEPCASQPCLFGGRCAVADGGDFACDCPARMSGRRCEYGRFCSPNPCKHGGACEEGDDGPLCKCRSFVGKYCEYDLNECESSPCQNGGTCVNSFGSFHCLCPSNVSGTYCASVFTSSVAFSIYGVSLEHLVYFGAAVVFLLLSSVILAVCLCARSRSRRRKRRENLKENVLLNSNRSHDMVEFKRTSKLSNLEVSQQRELAGGCAPAPARPLSFIANAPSPQQAETHANAMFKNLDTLRSYGSAAEELENVPADYVRNLNRGTPQGCAANHCDLDKTTWAEQMHMASSDRRGGKNYSAPAINKFNNKTVNQSSFRGGGGGGGSMRDDEDQRNSYHWDCSDWARHCQTLPNITEVPGSEILDSSSFHSNESNESRHPPSGAATLASFDAGCRHIETVDEDANESDFNVLDDYAFTPADNYLRHPNSYLPAHGYNIPNDVDLHSPPGTDSDEIVAYGFPLKRNRRRTRGDGGDDDDDASVITTLEERHSLLEGYVSNSDVSTNLCEIEDSECETESKPLNSCKSPSHQTDV